MAQKYVDENYCLLRFRRTIQPVQFGGARRTARSSENRVGSYKREIDECIEWLCQHANAVPATMAGTRNIPSPAAFHRLPLLLLRRFSRRGLCRNARTYNYALPLIKIHGRYNVSLGTRATIVISPGSYAAVARANGRMGSKRKRTGRKKRRE